jgi:glycopeptide antibiotics resistance protein
MSTHLLRRLAVAYTGIVLLLVTLPINGEDQFLGKLNDNYVLQIRFDYISHALLFIPWVVLVWLGWDWLTKSKPMQMGLLTVSFGFAIACECIQWPLTYRTFNINDLVSNSLGILLGYLLLRTTSPWLAVRLRTRLEP